MQGSNECDVPLQAGHMQRSVAVVGGGMIDISPTLQQGLRGTSPQTPVGNRTDLQHLLLPTFGRIVQRSSTKLVQLVYQGQPIPLET